MTIIQKYQEVYGYRDEPAAVLLNYKSFKSKIRITGKSPTADDVKDVKISVPLKYLRNIWRTFKMPLINCEINLILTWSENFVVSSATGASKFAITDTKLYVPVVTLSTQDSIKLLKQLESGIKKRIINWININLK